MITEGEYMITTLGFGCFIIVGLLILAWMYDEL
jgi:hypothetical protein